MSIFISLLSIGDILANSFHLTSFVLRTFSGESPSAIFLVLYVLALFSGYVLEFRVPRGNNSSTPTLPVLPGVRQSELYLDGVCVPLAYRDRITGSLPSLPASEGGSGAVIGRLGHGAFVWGASCDVGRLGHLGVSGPRDDLLSWPSFWLLGVLAYLVLFSLSLLS